MEVITANRPIYFERNVRSFAAIAKAQGVKTVFLSFAYRHIMPKKFARAYVNSTHHTKAIAEQNAILEAVAKESGSKFFDLQAGLPDDAAYWREDGVHFTKRGNQLRARLIAQFLRANGLVPGPVAAP
jgi:lysophospholipase L1-like esterase